MESESWAMKGSEHLAVLIDAVMMQSKKHSSQLIAKPSSSLDR